MKKSIFLAVLCLTSVMNSGHGQGHVIFSSYLANNGAGATTTYFGWGDTTPYLLPAGWTAGLYYALGSVSDPVDKSSILSTISVPTGLIDSGFTQAYASGGAPAGYFNGGNVTIPGYVSGPITFEIVAYNGPSYQTSTWRARSGSFTMDSIATGAPSHRPL